MKPLINFFKNNFWLLVLAIIEALIVGANYHSGTYFLGWDNLFPEMNFSLNIGRSLFAVWEEYRGLGLLDGMSYAANLPHYLFLWFLSWFLPTNVLRYAFFFLMHFLGGIGMYLLLSKEFIKKNLTALVGAIFYMLNLATVQMFYAPYELFAVHFAFLPWLMFYVLRFLRSGNRKDLIIFSGLSLAAVPQAHVPTIFLVYVVAVSIVALFNLNLKRIFVLFLTIFTINSFWLLPYSYNIFRGGAGTVIDAKINQMSRSQIYANQQARGDLIDIVTLKGFMLDSQEEGGYIMAPWREFLNTPLFMIGETIFLVLGIIGLLNIFYRQKKIAYPFVMVAFIAFFFLASDVPGFSYLNKILRDNFSLIGEGFRFSFTKFSIVFCFAYTIFVAFGLEAISKKRIIEILALILVIGYSFPTFQGHFLNNALKIEIPQEYFQTVNYFNNQTPDTRVALWPQPSYWSWRFNNFGYRGSGFLWYGIPQPTMDLAFDPWSRENENYYWEISQAVYSKNLPLLENVLNKYRVNWLLIDGNIVNPQSPKSLYVDEFKDLLKDSADFKLEANFGQISVYSYKLRAPEKSFVSVVENLPSAGPVYKWGNLDQAYNDLGDYIEGTNYIYSNRTLFTGKNQTDLEFNPETLPLKDLIYPENYSSLSHRDGYLIKVIGKPSSLFWIEDLNSRRAILETHLSVGANFVLPPMESDGIGYTFHGEFEKLTVNKIDYSRLISQKNVGVDRRVDPTYSQNFLVDHPNPSFYRVDVNTNIPATLILSQSFDSGWVAIGANNHILVNNWANGWQIEAGPRVVYLFFWPQLLEFVGFGLLGVFLVWRFFSFFNSKVRLVDL